MNVCAHKWHAETCLFCKLERERDEARREETRMIAEAARLREVLRLRGRHSRECDRLQGYEVRCICGLSAALGEGTP